MVKHEAGHSQISVASLQLLVVPKKLLDRQPAIDGGSQRHVPLRAALELQEEDELGARVERPAPPDPVGVAVPQSVVDEVRGQPAKRRMVDHGGPFGDLGPDEEFDHPGM